MCYIASQLCNIQPPNLFIDEHNLIYIPFKSNGSCNIVPIKLQHQFLVHCTIAWLFNYHISQLNRICKKIPITTIWKEHNSKISIIDHYDTIMSTLKNEELFLQIHKASWEMNVKSFHPSIIKNLFYLEKKKGITIDCNYNLTASYAMKVWPNKEQSNKRTKQCPWEKTIVCGEKEILAWYSGPKFVGNIQSNKLQFIYISNNGRDSKQHGDIKNLRENLI
jgi:hypothetical protein